MVFRQRERYLLLIAVCILAVICFSTFIFLPIEDVTPAQREGNGRGGVRQIVRDAFNRPNVVPLWMADNASMVNRRHGLDDDPHWRYDQSVLRDKVDKANIPAPPLPGLISDSDGSDVARREKIKEMTRFAWSGYARYAWGANELKPISKTGHSASIFGSGHIGATIIDGIDTLYIMGLEGEYDDARAWIEQSFDMKSDLTGDLSVFETNIRFVGGLLSIYALTNDELYKTKAVEVADLLLPAFDTPTGIPLALINMKTKMGHNWGWASGGASILSEYGTLQLEFDYLTVLTGNPIYSEKVQKIRQMLNSLDKPDGLYPNYLNPRTGKWGQKHVSMGALGDSFYEYLLKSWLITDKRDVEAKMMYDATMAAMEKQLIVQSKNGLTYFAELKGSRLDHKMDHLACFVAGLFALQSVNEVNTTTRDHFMHLARQIAYTCHESYIRTDTGIGPESFRFTNEFEAMTINERDKYYILRPEVIEGWFYLWRTTKDPKYREWCWTAAEAIERYCKADVGYSGIRNVYTKQVAHDDVQQSFFLAETLKYLYLTFTDDTVIPLNKWVFNTEAHPFPIRFNTT